jgi:hypothetical protein
MKGQSDEASKEHGNPAEAYVLWVAYVINTSFGVVWHRPTHPLGWPTPYSTAS